MTKDLALILHGSKEHYLTTEEFIDAVADELKARLLKALNGLNDMILGRRYEFQLGVLYRDNRATPNMECSLQLTVVASIIQYLACMEVTESDHKPVRCKLNVEIAHVDESVRRQEFGKSFQFNEKIKSFLEEFRYIPETIVSTSQIVLQNQDTYNLRNSSRSKEDELFFQITCGGQSTIKEDKQASEFRSRGSCGFRRRLEVTPAAGIIKPDQAAEILIASQSVQ